MIATKSGKKSTILGRLHSNYKSLLTYSLQAFHFFMFFRFVESGEWKLLETNVETSIEPAESGQYSVVTYSIKIRRRTLYYIMNFILPCVLIAVLAVLVFLLPPESGERVSYGITVILSFTILLLMLYVSIKIFSNLEIVHSNFIFIIDHYNNHHHHHCQSSSSIIAIIIMIITIISNCCNIFKS